MSDMDNTRYFMSKNHNTGKFKSIFKELTRSSSRPCIIPSSKNKLPTLLQVLRRAGKMTKELAITLPSDKEWRLKNYFKLLERQRQKKIVFVGMPSEEYDNGPDWDPVLLAQPETKKAKTSGISAVSSDGSLPTPQNSDIVWNCLDIATAGNLLKPGGNSVTFQDEDEMRRVFTLLYDVFRYKLILNEALLETGFTQRYPKYDENVSLVWLLFYDLHKRRFLPREHADVALCRDAFDGIGLSEIEEDLWTSRVKLAASLARHRIKNNALKLNQLLPFHLRDDKLVSIEDTPVTGWINSFKTSKKDVCTHIENLGLKLQSKHETVLTKSDFRFDHLCPKLLLCHPLQRAELAQSALIKEHNVVLQDRSFCLGPAMIGKILVDLSLRGTVAQTHVNSPRTTAYLANILAEYDKLDRVIAFGAGERLLEYQTYLHELGVYNCEIYAQRFADVHPEAAILENLVAVLATPPNSYTGVTDPVDLICSRGGDMSMLKALTQTDMGDDALGFLEEQKETLKYCMSLPQVQVVLYETHSVAAEENLGMVNSVIDAMNEWASEKHNEEHRIIQEHEEVEERANRSGMTVGTPSAKEQREREYLEAQEAGLPREIDVPPCDLFEQAPLPDLCAHGSVCLEDEGCFIARIQRKEIISLDAKYMIKIAEARGLFGAELGQKKSSTARAQKKREELVQHRSSSGSTKTKGRKIKLEIERITAPTQASIHRNRRGSGSSLSSDPSCPRHQSHAAESLNKGDDGGLGRSMEEKRICRVKKCQQEESVRRLSKPCKRSACERDFLSEIRPNFWKFATAKSIEDLIRALRRRKRERASSCNAAEIMKWKKAEVQDIIDPNLSTLFVNFFDNTIQKATISDYRSQQYTACPVSKSPAVISLPNSLREKSILQDEIDEAGKLFTEIGGQLDDRIVEYQKRLKLNTKDTIKTLQAMAKDEEFSHMIAPRKHEKRSNLILSSKYLPGKAPTSKEKLFLENLHGKLEKLQNYYRRTLFSKKQEISLVNRLTAKINNVRSKGRSASKKPP